VIRPAFTRKNLVTLLDTLWHIIGGAVRIFAWDSIKSGFIDVRHLPRVPRALALAGLVMVFGFLASILFNDPLRLSGALEALPLSSSAVRGIFVPSTAVPLAFIAVILAWTLLLTSALHIHGAVRWGILVCFILFGVPSNFVATATAASTENESLLFIIVGITALIFIALVLMFLLLPRFRLPVALEFTLMLACIGGLFVLMLFSAVRATSLGSVDFVNGYVVAEAVTNPRNLIVPLIYLSGAEIINFGITFTSWGGQATARFARAWIVTALLGVFLLYRWLGVLVGTILPGIPPGQWLAWAGAALAIVCLIPIALWRLRQPLDDRVPFKLIVGLILVILVPQLLALVGVILVSAFFLAQSATAPNVIRDMEAATGSLLAASTLMREALYLVLTVAGIAVAVIALRRKRYSVAAFGMILAWMQFVYWFTENGRPLQSWRYDYADVEIWLLIALTALTLYWAARRALTADRTLKLLALAVFTWLLHFTDCLDNPLPLIFGLAGVSATAFGILWGVLTAGGRWGVNSDTPQFPKMSRVLLAIGYVLLTVNISHWFLVTHNVQERTFNDDLTQAGLRIFGLTAAYLVIVEGGRPLMKQER
jgi:hypothetical protein